MSESIVRFRGSVRQRGAAVMSRGPVAYLEIRGDRITIGEHLPPVLAQLFWLTPVSGSISEGTRVLRERRKRFGVTCWTFALLYADGSVSSLEFSPVSTSDLVRVMKVRGLLVHQD